MRIKHPPRCTACSRAIAHQCAHSVGRRAYTQTWVCPSPCCSMPLSARGLCDLKGLHIPKFPGGPPLIYVIVCISSLFKGHLVCLLCSAFILCRYCGWISHISFPQHSQNSLSKTHSALRVLFHQRNRQTQGEDRKNNLAARSVRTDAYSALNKCQFCAVLLKIARDYPVSMAWVHTNTHTNHSHVDLLSNCQWEPSLSQAGGDAYPGSADATTAREKWQSEFRWQLSGPACKHWTQLTAVSLGCCRQSLCQRWVMFCFIFFFFLMWDVILSSLLQSLSSPRISSCKRWSWTKVPLWWCLLLARSCWQPTTTRPLLWCWKPLWRSAHAVWSYVAPSSQPSAALTGPWATPRRALATCSKTWRWQRP